MRRFLKNLFFVFLALDVLVVCIILRATVGTKLSAGLIEIRNAVFGSVVTDRHELEAPPSELVKNGFRVDPPELVAQWKEVLGNARRYRELFEQLDKMSSTVEKAKLITLAFSRNGTPSDADGVPLRAYDRTADLLFKFATIHEPRGFCSDHAQVFMAICSMAGIDAMEVNCAHTTSAVYAPELQKWVWIDSQFALLAKKPNGEYMSPLEVRDANIKGESFDYEFFGTPDHVFAKIDPRTFLDFRPETFQRLFGVEWGNAEFTRDSVVHQFLFVPKPIREFFMIFAGTQPVYHFLNDDPKFVARCYWIRIGFCTTVVLFLIGNLVFPAYLLIFRFWQPHSQTILVGSTHEILPGNLLSPFGQNAVN